MRVFFCLLALVVTSLGFSFVIEDGNIAKKASEITVYRKILVFVPSYNNERFCEQNLQSIFDQTYENYRVVYVDDASTDRTFEIVSEYIQKSDKKNKVTLIRNKKNQKQVQNLYDLVHSQCADDEIIVNLDGDDFFAHRDVLKNLNAYYQSPDVWMTWGSYVLWSTGEVGEHAKPVSRNFLERGKVRKIGFCYSHLRTFYARLFKNLQKEDLMVNGKFGQLAPDLLTMYPMLEMARLHAFFIPEILCIYNDKNTLAESNVTSREAFFELRDFVENSSPYPPIKLRDW